MGGHTGGGVDCWPGGVAAQSVNGRRTTHEEIRGSMSMDAAERSIFVGASEKPMHDTTIDKGRQQLVASLKKC